MTNKTRTYLSYVISSYVEENKTLLNLKKKGSMQVMGMYIGHSENKKIKIGEGIFMLVQFLDTTEVEEVLFKLSASENIIQNYPVYSDEYDNLHMFVFKVPDFINMEAFIYGRYSQIYKNQSYINKYVTTDKVKKILLKDVKLVEEFSERFGVTPDYIMDLDDKPILDNEIYGE